MTSLRMPSMSEGLHTNTSTFAQRKSTNTASYLGSRLELILNTLPSRALGSRRMSLVSSAGSKLSGMTLGVRDGPRRTCRGWRLGTPSPWWPRRA